MTTHNRFSFEKQIDGEWKAVELEEVSLGDTIQFYDSGHLAFHQQTKETVWVVDEDMMEFVADKIEQSTNVTRLPRLELLGTEIDSGSYSIAFSWIMDRMQDGNIEAVNDLFASYDLDKHSAEFMSGILRCASSQKRNIPLWLPVLKQVTEVMGKPLMGMSVEKMEAELSAEAKPDQLGAMFDRQILKVHPNLMRES